MNEQQKQLKAERDRRYRAKNAEKIAARRKKYREANKDKAREQQRRHRENNPESVKNRARQYWTQESWEKSPEAWLKRKVSKCSTKPAENRATYDDLIKLYYEQDGKCAITGIPMVHKMRDHRAISVDRIDSEKGYEVDNIQLVCAAINIAKKDLPDAQIREFVQLIAEHAR